MEIRQLEYFRAIVDAGTISGAARELHMTQPPLSYQMKMLEEELQVPLFIRGMKHITLTEAGKTLYEQAGKILMLSEVTKREVIKSSGGDDPYRNDSVHRVHDVPLPDAFWQKAIPISILISTRDPFTMRISLRTGSLTSRPCARQLR